MQAIICLPSLWHREAFISYCVEQLDLNTINYTLARCPTFGRRNMSPGLQWLWLPPPSLPGCPFLSQPCLCRGMAVFSFLVVHYPGATWRSVLQTVWCEMSFCEVEIFNCGQWQAENNVIHRFTPLPPLLALWKIYKSVSSKPWVELHWENLSTSIFTAQFGTHDKARRGVGKLFL